MSDGYIKLYRSILGWEWIDDPTTLRLWIQLLCTVNWEARNFKGIEVGPGQRIVSLTQLSKETGMSIRQIRTAKQHLIDTGEVTISDTACGDMFTVTNWAKYQSHDTHTDTASDIEADKQSTHTATRDRHEEEEIKEIKNNYYLARTHAQAHARATTKEERFDVNDGEEVRPGIWIAHQRPVTPEDKRALALKCREVLRAAKSR